MLEDLRHQISQIAMGVQYGALVRNLLQVKAKPAAAHKSGPRPARQVIDEIILHGTESLGTQEASAHSLAQSGEVQSIHYWIGRDQGLLYAIVPESRQAWHAGNPYGHARVQDHNPRSIGIELYQQDISRLGNQASRLDFTDWQYDTVAMLVFDICRRRRISRANVVGHVDVNSVDRGDPRNFDWPRFRRRLEEIATAAAAIDPALAAPA